MPTPMTKSFQPSAQRLAGAACLCAALAACTLGTVPVDATPGHSRPQGPSAGPAAIQMSSQVKRVPTVVGHLAVWDHGPPGSAPGAAAPHTLVLWPSILADRHLYAAQVTAWAARHRVIVIDGPGHGASGPAPGPFTMAQCGQAMAQVLDALGIAGPVVPVGTSWGGLAGAEFALAYPERTAALVMLNTPVLTAPGGPGFGDRFVAWGARWLHGTSLYTAGVARAFFLPSTRERGGAQLSQFHRHLHEADGAALAQAVRSVLIEREALAPKMARIAAPTLFVVGSEDSMYPMHELQQAAARLPRGRFVTLPTAHISAIDAPEAVTELVAEFVAELPAASR